MRIIIAPDSFKECMSAREVADIMTDAVIQVLPNASVVTIPLADGGEGTLDVLSEALNAEPCSCYVHDPLGRLIEARYAIHGSTAIIEVAQACGLYLLGKEERNPVMASSLGMGEMMHDAYNQGCRSFIIGLGGTATCDGGYGMISVPGLKDKMKECTSELLCDVTAPFVGPNGAAIVFAPQKGASVEDVIILEKRMVTLAGNILMETGIDIANMPGAGAAGGLAGALMAYTHAAVSSGAMRIMELCKFGEAVNGADLIITGEGKSDAQTLMGKVPHGVLQCSGCIPVALLSGRIDNPEYLRQAGFDYCIEVTPRATPEYDVLNRENATRNIRKAIFTLLKKFCQNY